MEREPARTPSSSFRTKRTRCCWTDSLRKGDLSKGQVLSKFAVDTGKNLLLDFGSDEILVKGLSDISDLKDDMSIV